MDESNGAWRTVGGRRIFIKDGEDLSTAMKNSGKFENKNKLDTLKHRKALLTHEVGRKDEEEIKKLDEEIEFLQDKIDKIKFHRKKLLENSVGRKDY